MATLRPYPAQSQVGTRPRAQEFPLAAAQTFVKGDIVELDGSGDVQASSGADPTPLLGLAREGAADVLVTGKVLVDVFTADTFYAMQGSRAPVDTDLQVAYGIVLDADGVWTVDATETVNTRVNVEAVDAVNNIWIVSVLAAHRQV